MLLKNHFKNPINYIINLHKNVINAQHLYFFSSLQMHVLFKMKMYFV